ncbi:MAG: 2-isopropylmalate synthase [Candidatus Omnitrophica bacterium]|nr:2-isopropylmalate synthase [Candidatus Omnitrophota bacterium]
MHTDKMRFQRYKQYPAVEINNRKWPDNPIIKAPIWCSVDLRDGNQALSVPMNIEEKIKMFELLVSIGFKQIEVGFPSASEVEYQFVRKIIAEQLIPDDVTIQVLTQARAGLIKKTFESLSGVKKAIVHLYNSTSKVQREVVFRKNKQEIMAIAVEGTKLIKALKSEMKNSDIFLEYTPESFSGTELDYALEVCSAVIDIWAPSPENKIIINLPTTVEMSTPNIFADRIEWFCRQIKNKQAVIISVHTHNDRGTAVASAELAVMAGAQRVEGALFGNGERSGNMDIVTMALNLFSQGVNPELDFSDINKIEQVYRKCTKMDIHPRHPYAGELVYTAFSGSHQDAINKGLKAQAKKEKDIWDVPYLPIDPKDVGRTYEAIIRINSQSGKGGIAYIMENDWGFKLPQEMQPEFARLIQTKTERIGNELSTQEIKNCFDAEYINCQGRFQLKSYVVHSENEDLKKTVVCFAIQDREQEILIIAKGNGPVDAFVCGIKNQFNISFDMISYSEHSLACGSDAQAVAYIGIKSVQGYCVFGVGIDANISIASIKAVLSAINRL